MWERERDGGRFRQRQTDRQRGPERGRNAHRRGWRGEREVGRDDSEMGERARWEVKAVWEWGGGATAKGVKIAFHREE